jgi:hypothetical protein
MSPAGRLSAFSEVAPAPTPAVASIASEDCDFYEYNGPAPAKRGLETYCVYRVNESDKVDACDDEHVVLCLSRKTIELAGRIQCELGLLLLTGSS